jgi:CRP-like cAMP-binding protein
MSIVLSTGDRLKRGCEPLRLGGQEKAALLRAAGRVVGYEAHRIILREDERATPCVLLLEGIAFRHITLADGGRQILGFDIAGGLQLHGFGVDEMDHSLTALTACRVALIGSDSIAQISERMPSLRHALRDQTLRDAAILGQWMASMGRRSASARVAHRICELAIRLETAGWGSDHHLAWPISQVELADALGLSHVHVNRTLQELRRARLIDLRRGSLYILDWQGLKTAGDFDAKYLHLGAPQRAA